MRMQPGAKGMDGASGPCPAPIVSSRAGARRQMREQSSCAAAGLLLNAPTHLSHPPTHCYLQHSLPRGCLRPDRVRRAQPPCTTTARWTETRTTASTTPRWTGGSSCATPGTWSPPSGQQEPHSSTTRTLSVLAL